MYVNENTLNFVGVLSASDYTHLRRPGGEWNRGRLRVKLTCKKDDTYVLHQKYHFMKTSCEKYKFQYLFSIVFILCVLSPIPVGPTLAITFGTLKFDETDGIGPPIVLKKENSQVYKTNNSLWSSLPKHVMSTIVTLSMHKQRQVKQWENYLCNNKDKTMEHFLMTETCV